MNSGCIGTYDAVGNMTSIPKPADLTDDLTCKYDAWNRLVEVTDGDNTIARYEYDGLGRRIKRHVDDSAPDEPDGTLDDYIHYFYNAAWQVLETRVSASEETGPESLQPLYQYEYSLRYIDAVSGRFKNTDDDWECDDEEIRYLNDANFNVTRIHDGDDGHALRRGDHPRPRLDIPQHVRVQQHPPLHRPRVRRRNRPLPLPPPPLPRPTRPLHQPRSDWV